MKIITTLTTFLAFFTLATAYAQDITVQGSFENDDGTVTFIHPQIASGQNKLVDIDAQSSTQGVCRNLNYSFHVDHVTKVIRGSVAVIGSDGALVRIAEPPRGVQAGALTSIICGMEGNLRWGKSSTRFTSPAQTNPDQSVRINAPAFGYIEGQVRSISALSDLDGVCVLYGYAKAHRDDLGYTRSAKKPSVFINRNGKYQETVLKDERTDNPTIDAITCETELPFQFNERLKIDQLSDPIRFVAKAAYPHIAQFIEEMAAGLDRIATASTKFDPTGVHLNEGRLFFLNALDTLIGSIDAEAFKSRVAETFHAETVRLNQTIGVTSPDQITASSTTGLAALMTAQAAINALKNFSGSTEIRSALMTIQRSIGTAMATSGGSLRVDQVLNDWQSVENQLNTFTRNSRTEGIADVLIYAMNYLKAHHE